MNERNREEYPSSQKSWIDADYFLLPLEAVNPVHLPHQRRVYQPCALSTRSVLAFYSHRSAQLPPAWFPQRHYTRYLSQVALDQYRSTIHLSDVQSSFPKRSSKPNPASGRLGLEKPFVRPPRYFSTMDPTIASH